MHEPLGTARDDEKIVLSIVLPCFREHANLELLLPSIHEEFRDVSHEVVVVDDGSADGTVELVGKFSTLYGNVRLIERDRRLGIGSALREGYAAARGEFILSSDADLSFNDRALVLPSPGVVRLLGSSFAGCGGRGGECSSGASDSLVVVRAAELLFGESKVAEWDSVAASLHPDRRFEGFAKLTRQELLTLPPSRLLRPGRRTVIGSFGPLDVNYAYYPNWIASDRIVILTPRRAAEAVCGAPDSSASLPVLRRAVCPPAPFR